MIYAAQLEKLKNKYERAMSMQSTRNKAHLDDLWEKIVQSHKNRPYHNLKLAFGDLFLKREIEGELVYISNELVIALLFRHMKFHPVSTYTSIEQSVDYMSHTLESAFGWPHRKIVEVANLIKASHSFLAFTDNTPFAEKLIRDMKTARLGKSYQEFVFDRDNLASELIKYFNMKDIYTTELRMFKGLQKRKVFFNTGLCKSFTESVQENIGKRIEDLTDKLEHPTIIIPSPS